MRIIKRIADDVVLFAADILELDESGVHGDGWTARNVDHSQLTLIDVETIPPNFVGGGWTYIDGTWASNAIADAAILPKQRADKIAQIRAAYARAISVPIGHAGKTWDADKPRTDLLAHVVAIGSVPEGMYWRDSSGIPQPMIYADLQALAFAIFQRGFIADQNQMAKIAAVMSAETSGQIEAITW